MNCSTQTARLPNVMSTRQACCAVCAQQHHICNVIDGFIYRRHLAGIVQRQKITEIARRLLTSNRVGKTATVIRIVGHLDVQEFRQGRFYIAQRRAAETARILKQTLEGMMPDSSRRFRLFIAVARQFQPVGANASLNRRVEICLPEQAALPQTRNPNTEIPNIMRGETLHYEVRFYPKRNDLEMELEAETMTQRRIQMCLNRLGTGLAVGSKVVTFDQISSQLGDKKSVSFELDLMLNSKDNSIRGANYQRDVVAALRKCFGNKWNISLEKTIKRKNLHRRMDVYLEEKANPQNKVQIELKRTKTSKARVSKNQITKDRSLLNKERIKTFYVKSSPRRAPRRAREFGMEYW